MSTSKPPKLKLDKTYGGTNPAAKYRTDRDFVTMHRAYWWTQGYDVKAFGDNTSCKLTCANDPRCTYSVLAEWTTFTDGPLAGQSGWHLPVDAFNASHSHPAPYVPMDPAAENARRRTLSHDDPSLENPPLVRAAPPAGTTSSGVGGGGADGFARAASVFSVAGGGGGGVGGEGRFQTPSMGTAAGMNGTPPTPGGQLPPVLPQGYGAMPPPGPAHGGRQSFGGGGGAVPPQQQQTYTGAFGSPAAPAPSLAQHNPHAHEPLGQFLLSISPSFQPYLASFAAANIPLSTSPLDLLDLDEGTPSDRTIFNVFREVDALPPFLVALAADGVRKAKNRRDEAVRRGEPGAQQKADGRIATPLEKARAEKWVRRKIKEGEQKRAAMAAGAQGGAAGGYGAQQQGMQGVQYAHL
ncbi:hypothetical protein JCM10207_008846 [Rhodosporidiobolus poonsookiae]